MKKQCILYFVKYPEPGRVKTRLARKIGDELTVDLYRCFILDLLSMICKTGFDYRICIYPAEKEQLWNEWLGSQHNFYLQHGENLGEKMENAFADAFGDGYQEVVIIGSDSPDLSAHIQDAFDALQTDDMVIGPTFDGGYYLLGFRQSTFTPVVFRGIKWSSEEVYVQTLAVIKKQHLKHCELIYWRDIDTLSDLIKFYTDNSDSLIAPPETMVFLNKHKEQLFKGIDDLS